MDLIDVLVLFIIGVLIGFVFGRIWYGYKEVE